jgi:hypothetical protein
MVEGEDVRHMQAEDIEDLGKESGKTNTKLS